MAKKKTTMEVNVKGTGIKSTAKNVKNTRKETEKLDKSQENLSGSTNRYHKLQKGVAQAGANSTKNFSKMNQTLGGDGGSSGLVAAYATLAANVFAATAAFGALQRAAEFENLKKGLHELGHQSGRTLSILADGLRDVTGGALSAEEAMRGAALGISGGFGGAELEGLAKIAKGAAITLGRNLPDAFDRLTRGAIKLEPEILDELGIMVRVDEAAENYATQLGKTVGSMTQMEKRQAFMNEILVQGEAKFGEIAEAVDPDPYTKLAATFADLTKEIFSFFNETLGLGKVVEFLAENVTVLAGVMLLFGSTIASKMLPFLADGAAAAHKQAERMAALAEATLNAGEAQKALSISQLGTAKAGNFSKGYVDMAAAIKEGGAEMKDLQKMQKSLNGSIGHYSSQAKMGSKINSTANKQRLVQLEMEKQKLAQIIAMEQGRHVDMLKFNKLQSASIFADDAAIAISNYTAGVSSLGDSFGDINKGFGNYVKNVNAAKEALLENGATLTMSQKLMTRLGGATKWLGKQFRLLGAAIMKSIIPIALIVIAIGTAIALWNKFYNTKEQKAYKKGMDELKQLIDEMSEKVDKMNKAWNNTKNLADGQLRAFEIQSGMLSEITAKMKENIKLREEANKSRPSDNDIGFKKSDAETLAPVYGASGTLEDMIGTDELGSLTKQARIDLLRIFGSAEWKTAAAVLESEVPDAVSSMQAKAKKILKDGIGDMDPQEWADLWGVAVREVESEFGNLGPAAKGLREAFKELEKESSKFLSEFGRKTSVDGFVKSFEGVDKAFAEFKATVKDDADLKTWEANVGRALMDITGKTALLMGAEFSDAKDNVLEIQSKIQQMEVDTGLTVDEMRKGNLAQRELVKTLDESLINLFKQSGAYSGIRDDVKQIQRFETMRKSTMKFMSKLQKDLAKVAKAGFDLEGRQYKIALQRLEIEKELAQLKLNLISKELQGMTKTVTKKEHLKQLDIWLTSEVEEQIGVNEFLEKSYHEQNQLIEKFGKDTKLLNEAREAYWQQEIRGIEILRAEMQLEDLSAIQKAEALKKELDAKKKLVDKTNELAEVELKLLNYKTKGTTELDAGDEARLRVDAAVAEFQHAMTTRDAEKDLIRAKADMQKTDLFILDKQIELSNKMTRNLMSEQLKMSLEEVDKHIEGMEKSPLTERISKTQMTKIEGQIDRVTEHQEGLIDKNAELLGRQVQLAVTEGLEAVKEALESGDIDFGKALMDQIYLADQRRKGLFKDETLDEKDARGDKGGGKGTDEFTLRDRFTSISTALAPFKRDLAEISEEGAGISQFISGIEMMSESLFNFSEATDMTGKLTAVQGVLSGIGSAISGQAKAATAAIDQQIQAEEKRDGKSKESLKKIEALKLKKYQIEKKAFEQNKKISIAQALMSTYQGVAAAWSKGLPWGAVEAAIVLAMGMAQVKAIQSTQFGGTKPGGAAGAGAANTALNIGKRGSSVDVSRGASGGELGYLRGQRGYGTASNFVPTGGAAGLRRGYQTGGVLVGEQGPEMIQPRGSYEVVPNDRLGGGMPNVNFTINAIDAAGVEDVITRQRGHIINLIRSAANDNGEQFLEQVDTQVLA